MQRKFLEDLGLEKEAIDKIMSENGADLEKQKEKHQAELQVEKEKLTGAQAELKATTEQVNNLKAKGNDLDTAKKEVDEWKKKHETDTAALQEKLQKQTLDSGIEVALLSAKAKNQKAVRALLNLDSISMQQDGIKGLSEQLSELQKENPYLFGEDRNPTPTGGGDPQQSFTQEEISKMSPAEINKNWGAIKQSL